MNILQKFAPIKSFIIDVEGCMGGNRLGFDDNDKKTITLNTKDILAIEMALEKDYNLHFFSRYEYGHLPITAYLQTQCRTQAERIRKLEQLVSRNKADLSTTLYLGNDLPDITVMKMVALPCCASNAAIEVKEIAAYISPSNSGEGVVRDVLEKVLKMNGDWL